MSDALNPGDVVQLRSGGPKMTVVRVSNERDGATVWCEWFDDKGAPVKRSFAPSSVMVL